MFLVDMAKANIVTVSHETDGLRNLKAKLNLQMKNFEQKYLICSQPYGRYCV